MLRRKNKLKMLRRNKKLKRLGRKKNEEDASDILLVPEERQFNVRIKTKGSLKNDNGIKCQDFRQGLFVVNSNFVGLGENRPFWSGNSISLLNKIIYCRILCQKNNYSPATIIQIPNQIFRNSNIGYDDFFFIIDNILLFLN